MKKLSYQIRKFYPVISMVLMTIVLYGGVKPASWLNLYQPKMPKCLK